MSKNTVSILYLDNIVLYCVSLSSQYLTLWNKKGNYKLMVQKCH
jgi:hypothetical protein